MKRISRSVVYATLVGLLASLPAVVQAEPIGLKWPQPAGPGTDVFVTYSYSNLFEGSFLLIPPAELRTATEEALGVWAQYAPLYFLERPDSGPSPSDTPYAANGHPQIRIGAHPMQEIAHAFFPGATGLAGDVHFDPSLPWSLGTGRWNFLEALTHELGHALGLEHEVDVPAIMNPIFPLQRFSTLGTAFLLPADIAALQALYGPGQGSVQPLPTVPEPAAIILVGTGLAGLVRACRRRFHTEGDPK